MEIRHAPFSVNIFLTLRTVLGVTIEIKFCFSCKLGKGFDKGSVSEQINTI